MPQTTRAAAMIVGATCRPGSSGFWRSLALWLWVPTLRLSDFCVVGPGPAQPCWTYSSCFLEASARGELYLS